MKFLLCSIRVPRGLGWLSLALGALLALPAAGLAQETAVPGASAPEETVLQSILKTGPLGIMIWLMILAASIVMVTFVIQNFLTLRADRLAPPTLVRSLKDLVAAGNYQEAWETCRANRNYLANVLRSGLERLGRGKDAVEDALAEHALREATVLRTRNSYLSVIGVVSPMIGLLGTVIGMIKAFATLGRSGIGDPRALAGAIGEVLLATASGLFIAIPAFIFYYVFRNKTQSAIVAAEDRISAIIEDVPYEELQGLRIGENFSAGEGVLLPGAASSRRVSMALTTNCPVCNAAITAGETPCPQCGSTLDWAG
ncbi:MAG: MotA/TolQ/ExbB proton channel family protein [Verrucomicrobia bacterium]|nr:MotA/TolQ/ExbB proton channel family protein [Verrucomicrobiota bacterium]